MLEYIKHLGKQNFHALGFIPLPMMEKYIEHGQVLMETENDDPCGYLLFGNGFPVMKIYQACIQYDARKIKHGMALLKRLIKIAERKNCTAISLWCADDLESNQFWKAAGFIFAGKRDGGKGRVRKHNKWVLPIGGLFIDTPGAGRINDTSLSTQD